MRPKTPFALGLCIFITLAASGLLIARVIGWIDINRVTIAIACIVGAGSGFMVIKEYFRKPFIKEYSHEDWIVKNPNIRTEVYIKISKSEHGAGNKPSYSFIKRGALYSIDLEVDDQNGDLTIYHPQNSFQYMYKSFVIRII